MKLNICQSDLAYLKPADRAVVLASIRDFGFTKVRWEVPMHTWLLQGRPYDWAPILKTAADIADAGLQSLPVLGAHRPWWKPGSKVYASWASQAVSVIKKELDVPEVELWNEPNLTNFWPNADPATFYPFAQAGYDAIKSAYPDITVILAGLAACGTGKRFFVLPGPKDPIEFLNALHKAAGGRKFYDRLAYHPYSLNEAFVAKKPAPEVFGIKRMTDILEYDRQAAATEFGITGTGSATNAADLTTLLSILRPKVTEGYLYCWRDTQGEKFGLVDAKNRPKEPIYSTVKNMLSTM